jgi:rhamnosyltransferase
MNLKTAAGIVLYNPDTDRLKQNIDAVIHQVDYVILSDNGSSNTDEIDSLLDSYDKNVIIIFNHANLGIASALNIIFRKAGELGCDWILTLDDDSVCPDNMVSNYISFLESSSDRAGIICPVIKDKNVGIIEGCTQPYEYIRRSITSGSFTSYAAWWDVHGFDEKLFIDGVDFDFSDRLITAGYKIIRLKNTELLHELGHMTSHRFLLWHVKVQNHPALRKYYIVRNRVYVSKKEKQRLYALTSLLFTIKFSLTVILYEKDKKKKLSSIMKGYADGLKM